VDKMLIGKAHLYGYFKSPIEPFGKPKTIVKNRLNRNLARIIASAIDKTGRTLVSVHFNGTTTNITLRASEGMLYRFACPNTSKYGDRSGIFLLMYGTGTTSEKLDDNDLESKVYWIVSNYWDVIEEVDKTKILVSAHHRPPSTFDCYEVGLGRVAPGGSPPTNNALLLSRVTFESPIVITEGEDRFDGWEIIFSNNFSKWFIRLLLSASKYGSDIVKNINGNNVSLQQFTPLGGTPKVRLGDGTTTPSPDDYGLSGSELVVADALITITEDATNDILKISAYGTITPTSALNVNEVALFTTVKDEDDNLHEILVARDVFPTTQTLNAGTTYTVGIDLIF